MSSRVVGVLLFTILLAEVFSNSLGHEETRSFTEGVSRPDNRVNAYQSAEENDGPFSANSTDSLRHRKITEIIAKYKKLFVSESREKKGRVLEFTTEDSDTLFSTTEAQILVEESVTKDVDVTIGSDLPTTTETFTEKDSDVLCEDEIDKCGGSDPSGSSDKFENTGTVTSTESTTVTESTTAIETPTTKFDDTATSSTVAEALTTIVDVVVSSTQSTNSVEKTTTETTIATEDEVGTTPETSTLDSFSEESTTTETTITTEEILGTTQETSTSISSTDESTTTEKTIATEDGMGSTQEMTTIVSSSEESTVKEPVTAKTTPATPSDENEGDATTKPSDDEGSVPSSTRTSVEIGETSGTSTETSPYICSCWTTASVPSSGCPTFSTQSSVETTTMVPETTGTEPTTTSVGLPETTGTVSSGSSESVSSTAISSATTSTTRGSVTTEIDTVGTTTTGPVVSGEGTRETDGTETPTTDRTSTDASAKETTDPVETTTKGFTSGVETTTISTTTDGAEGSSREPPGNSTAGTTAGIGENLTGKFDYVVYDGRKGVYCILSKMMVIVKAIYRTNGTTVSRSWKVPREASVRGVCGETRSWMTLSWAEPEATDDTEALADIANNLTFFLANDGKAFFVDYVAVDVRVDDNDDGSVSLSANTSRGLRLFPATLARGVHKCDVATRLRAVGDDVEVVLTIDDVVLIAYNEAREVDGRIEESCLNRRRGNIWLIVGGILAGVIAIGIVGVFVWRTRRPPARRIEVA